MSVLGLNGVTATSEGLRTFLRNTLGQYISCLCARYAYRGINLGFDDSVLVLGAGYLVEAAGSSDQSAPTTEDPLVNNTDAPALIALGGVETFFFPQWALAPLLGRDKKVDTYLVKQLGTSGAAAVKKGEGIDADDPILQKWGVGEGFAHAQAWMEAQQGKKMAALCSRFNYRGYLDQFDEQGFILRQPTMIETAGPAIKDKPTFESALGPSCWVPTGSVEMLYTTRWTDAPLPGEDGFGSGNNS